MNNDLATTSVEARIEAAAIELGFDACGFAECVPLTEEAHRFAYWVKRGNAAQMDYLTTSVEQRADVRSWMPEAQSVVVVLLSYFAHRDCPYPYIARYAHFDDYHFVMWRKLSELMQRMPAGVHRATCDTMPVLERAWAVRAGLGWIGKSGMLVNPRLGTYTFIGCIFTSLKLKQSHVMPSRCGKCAACIKACPTQAIGDERTIDARKCVSYHTIESRASVPEPIHKAARTVLFGCDACQDCCPWNRKVRPTHNSMLTPTEGLYSIDWEHATASLFRHALTRSALSRAGARKLRERYKQIIDNE